MKILFWISVGIVFMVYFGYPLFIAAVAWLRRPILSKADVRPTISLIFPLHNEESVVRRRVENTLALDYPSDKLEFIFALDNCTDRTREFLTEYHDPRIKILDFSERAGKVAVLNKAVPTAVGDIIVFSDANTIHQKDTLLKVVRNFADPKIGCVCGNLLYTESEHTLVGRGESLYWKYEHFIKRCEGKLGCLLITNGSMQAVRRAIYPFPDPEVADDMSIPILIRAQGYKIVYEPEAIVYEVATQSAQEEFAQKVRIVAQGFRGTVRLARAICQTGLFGTFQFLVHKLLRWLVFALLALALASNVTLLDERLYLLFFVLQLAFYALAFIGLLLGKKHRITFFYVPFYFCLVNFASIMALKRFVAGGETRMWEKAETTRART